VSPMHYERENRLRMREYNCRGVPIASVSGNGEAISSGGLGSADTNRVMKTAILFERDQIPSVSTLGGTNLPIQR